MPQIQLVRPTKTGIFTVEQVNLKVEDRERERERERERNEKKKERKKEKD